MGPPIRLAASLIGVREGSEGPEVLVIERTREHRFLPGYVAFPGGAVDPSDAALAERWFGDPWADGRAAAIRELAEEVALAVTADGVEPADPERPLASIDAAPPSVSDLAEIARWIAPQRVPVRFDARYYAVRMDGGVRPRPDGAEAAAAWWESPTALLAAWETGARLLYWPTHFTIEALAACRSVDEVMALRIETREPIDEELERLPRSLFFQA
jgi:8-oxo-dGTP pyrophosphatase MutT (NUDIX family)